MTQNTWRRPENLWLLGAGLVLVVLVVWAVGSAVAVYRNASASLSELEPRHARVAGLLQNEEQLAQSEQAVKANLADFIYPAEGEAGQIGNQALQRVRDLATARGLRVASSQVSAPREDKGFDRIGLSLRLEGDWTQLQNLMAELARQKPVIFSELIQVGALGGPMPGRALPMSGQFELYVLKERRS